MINVTVNLHFLFDSFIRYLALFIILCLYLKKTDRKLAMPFRTLKILFILKLFLAENHYIKLY